MARSRRTLREFAGQREGLTLEFKNPAALEDRESIARETCALLNASGGEIVIGIDDDGSLAPIPELDLEAEAKRLRDRLASLIAPSLPERVRVAPLEGGGLLVKVERADEGANGLFAVRFTKGRFGVFRRVDDRIVALDWSEIRERLGDRAIASFEEGERPETALIEWRGEFEGTLERTGGLLAVWGLQPRRDPAEARECQERARRALEDPGSIGIRRNGLHYGVPEPATNKRLVLRSGSREELYRAVELDLRGQLCFATRLDSLLDGKGGRTIHPLALIETLASCNTLFASVLTPDAPGTVTAALDLLGIDGRSCPPYRHDTYGFMFDAHWNEPHEGDALSEIVTISFDARTFTENPHAAAHRMVSWIYEEFGYDDKTLGANGEKIPYWDADARRFVFP